MKKFLASLLVLALCAPVMAATVTINDNGDGTGTIVVDATAEGLIVGLGLNIDTTGGNITALSIEPATFNIFPDAAHDMELTTQGSYGYGDGTPIANQDAVGEAALSSSFAVSVGMLNGETTAGAAGAAVVTINIAVDAATNICVEENAIRGGIVLTDGTGVDIDGAVVCGDVIPGPVVPTCQDYNLTKLTGGTDNLVNVSDINLFIGYVNTNKTGSFFVVNAANPNYDPLYNITAKQGGTDTLINVSDLNALISWINATKTGTFFVVNCSTCGC
jgi:hypothetical protein